MDYGIFLLALAGVAVAGLVMVMAAFRPRVPEAPPVAFVADGSGLEAKLAEEAKVNGYLRGELQRLRSEHFTEFEQAVLDGYPTKELNLLAEAISAHRSVCQFNGPSGDANRALWAVLDSLQASAWKEHPAGDHEVATSSGSASPERLPFLPVSAGSIVFVPLGEPRCEFKAGEYFLGHDDVPSQALNDEAYGDPFQPVTRIDLVVPVEVGVVGGPGPDRRDERAGVSRSSL